MDTMTKLDEVRTMLYGISRLKQISRRLNGIGTRNCNGYHSAQQEKRDQNALDKLTTEAREIAVAMGLRFYRQTDPRGCAVYLIDETMDESTYNRGIAIY